MLQFLRIVPIIYLLLLPINTQSNLQQLNLVSPTSLVVLSPFFFNNPTIKTALTKNITLVMNTQFQPLFAFILNNATITNITLANISTINPLKWTQNMTMMDIRTFLIVLMNQKLSLFYQMMTAAYYPAT